MQKFIFEFFKWVFWICLPLIAVPFFMWDHNFPELLYTLSDPIPSDFASESKDEIIQEVSLRNSGKNIANNIKIHIDKRVLDYRINAYSQADDPMFFSKDNFFEVTYPKLPPSGELTLLIKVRSPGIKNSNLEIAHDGGAASEALDRKKRDNLIVNFYWFFVFIVFYFCVMARYLWSIKHEEMERLSKKKPQTFLKKRKPFYLSGEKWQSLRNLAIDNFGRNDYSRNIKDLEAFAFLNREKPSYLSDEECIELLKNMEDELVKKVSMGISNYHLIGYNKYIEEVLGLEKPINMNIEKWNEIISKAADLWLTNIKITILKKYRLSEEDTEERLGIVKAESFPIDHEQKDEIRSLLYKIKFQGYVFTDFFRLIMFESDIDNWRGVSGWLQDDDAEKIELFIGKIKDFKEKENELRRLKLEVDQTVSLIDNALVFDFDFIPKMKPDNVSIEIWQKVEKLKEIKIKILNKKSRLDGLRGEIEVKEADLGKARKKISKQLYFLDSVLSDPNFIDKIEDFERDVFAPGNFENLKKIAFHMSSNFS